jgi:uncharacterized protein (TIGR02284 family)
MNATATNLNELIEILHDGSKFYLSAATEMKDSEYSSLFLRMANGKRAIAADLAAHVAAHGEQASLGLTLAGGLRESYAKLRVSMTSDKEGRYIAELEDAEDRILHAFEDAVGNSEEPELVAIASKHMPEVLAAHEQMRELKKIRGY